MTGNSFVLVCLQRNSLIISLQPDRIVYVSCDAVTQARDCKIFKDKRYEIKKLSAVDLFPDTTHVESVAVLER